MYCNFIFIVYNITYTYRILNYHYERVNNLKETKKDKSLTAETVKKRPGRKPMSAAEKAAAAKVRAEEKAKADSLKPEVFVQFQESETTIDALIEAAKADFRKTKKRTLITAMKLYVKPEEKMAYYVINEDYKGEIAF